MSYSYLYEYGKIELHMQIFITYMYKVYVILYRWSKNVSRGTFLQIRGK